MKFKFHLTLCCAGLLFQNHFVWGQNEDYADRKSYVTKSQISAADKLRVFNNLWEAVNRLYFDATFNGRDWSKLREIYEPQALAAKDKIEFKIVLNKFVSELNTSHLNVGWEISISGKTLDKMFGKNADYKNNDILFGYGYTRINLGNQLVVTEVIKNTSAEQLGVKPGWIEKSCESHPFSQKDGDNLIFSENTDCIFITENEAARNIRLSQSWFLSPRAKTQRISKLLPGNILYLKFTQFDKGSGEWLKQQIKNNDAVKSLIVDLRGNVGGWIDEVKESLSAIFPPQTVIGEFIERDLDQKSLRVGSNTAYQGPINVLIDGGSTSGAEIFAAAVQDFQRGKIIGQKSGGQVLNSTDRDLSGGFKLHIAFRDYKTVKDVRLEGTGVKPDLEIPFSIDDFRRQKDFVLEKTLEILNK